MRNFKPAALLLTLVVVLAIPMMAQGAIYMKQLSHTDAFEMQGQQMPAKTDTIVTWVTENKGKMEMGDSATVLTLAEENAMYMINHKDKIYSKIPLDALGDVSKMMAGEGATEQQKQQAEMMKQMMSAMKISAEVEPTELTKEIQGYECTRYDVTMSMGMVDVKTEVWATDEINVNYDIYNKMNYFTMSSFPGFSQAMEQMKKVKGVAIETTGTLTMMGNSVPMYSRLLEFEEKKAPEGTFDLPEGYSEKPFTMPGMGQ